VRWQDTIDAVLSETLQSFRGPMPQNIIVPHGVRQVVDRLEGSTTEDYTALQVTQVITEYAITNMVEQLAATASNGPIHLFARVGSLWADRTTYYNSTIYTALNQVATLYLSMEDMPRLDDRLTVYGIGAALWCTCDLLGIAYPVDLVNPYNNAATPTSDEMPQVIAYFAILACVHREVCGVQMSDMAIAELCERLNHII